MEENESQIPKNGPLSILTENEWTGVSENLRYGGRLHLRKSYRIPIDILHFNIMNGRYRTRYLLLQKANPEVVIDPTQTRWRQEILSLLNGTWEDKNGIGTKNDRKYFIQLVDDIREHDQERPGIVLETGGVMSGNRRLAALITLYNETQNQRYRYFQGFIIPSSDVISNADLWHLEMSAQIPPRLTQEYGSVDRLLKIREGVDFYNEINPGDGEGSAIRAVAFDFGQTEEYIRGELMTLFNIEQYLVAIGHPGEWWLAEGLTEIFTEFGPLKQALETNAVAYDERNKLLRSIYSIIRNGNADYRFLRDIRTAVGPVTGKRGARKMPSVSKILIDAAPSPDELRVSPSLTSQVKTDEIVDRFKSAFEANKEKEAPITKAQRAEVNLQKLVDMLDINQIQKWDEIITSLEHTIELAQKVIKMIKSKIK
jgi:hypothetical protein